jgi:outer membrane protein OmpA-like peptidoglycan-associated protein
LLLVKPEADAPYRRSLRAPPVVVFQGAQTLPDTIWWEWIEFHDQSDKESESHPLQRWNANGGDTLCYAAWLRDKLGHEAQSDWQNVYIQHEAGGPATVEVERIPIILFAFNEHKLDKNARYSYKKILQVADKLKSAPQTTCALVGFTDAIGQPAYNLHLSIQRAHTIYTALANFGGGKKRMNYSGLGKERPLGDNRFPEGRIMNRRVELYIKSEH